MKINEQGYCIDNFSVTYKYLYTEEELKSIKELLKNLKDEEVKR